MMLPRMDLLDADSLPGIEIFQLTAEPDCPGSHLYMEAQVFTPDSKRFLLHRSAHPHGFDPADPAHQYLLCDLDHGAALTPVLTEPGASSPSVSPDGNHIYYFIDETVLGGGRLTLKRANLDGTDRQTLFVLDRPLPGTSFRPSQLYPLSTVSSDGTRLAISAFLGDGTPEGATWGLMVFDLVRGGAELILHGKDWCNVHPQYCRSPLPEHRRDIMVQQNHGCTYDAAGNIILLVGREGGADIHLIRDDGTEFRDFPWGRDPGEHCQGHQCWQGLSDTAITSTVCPGRDEARLIQGIAGPPRGHLGLHRPDLWRNDLTKRLALRPDFYHFATDRTGTLLVTDCASAGRGWGVYLGALRPPGDPAARDGDFANPRLLLRPRSAVEKGAHIHPFLSPDGKRAFFNSDESGILQAYMALLP